VLEYLYLYFISDTDTCMDETHFYKLLQKILGIKKNEGLYLKLCGFIKSFFLFSYRKGANNIFSKVLEIASL